MKQVLPEKLHTVSYCDNFVILYGSCYHVHKSQLKALDGIPKLENHDLSVTAHSTYLYLHSFSEGQSAKSLLYQVRYQCSIYFKDTINSNTVDVHKP
jgi:hypothetical protein